MNIFAISVLLIITIYTFGFAVTLWKERQKTGALAVFFIIIAMVILPFFSIF